jgi:phosphoglycerate dehydrogenase-like enzyme
VVLTPHIGNDAIETKDQMTLCAAKNIIQVLKGENINKL